MSAERIAMRALIDALEYQELIENWLSLPGTKDITLDLEVATGVGRSCGGYFQVMRAIEEAVNTPEMTGHLVAAVKANAADRVAKARAALKAVQA